MNEKTKRLVAIGFAIVILSGVYSTKSGWWPFMSIISLDDIEIDPAGGYVSDGKLRGAYWVIVFAVDSVEQLTGTVTLPAGTEAEFDGDTIYTGKEVVVQFDPQKAYFTRSMQSSTVQVVPETHATTVGLFATVWPDEDVSRPPLYAEYWSWSEDKWNAHSVFGVTVSSDGTEIGSRVFDTEGVAQDLDIDTNDGSIKVRYLGGLTGGWSAPTLDDLVLISENYIYDASAVPVMTYDEGAIYDDWKAGPRTKVQRASGHNDPFSTYWYGDYRWTDTPAVVEETGIGFASLTPAGVREDAGNPSVLFLNIASSLPGWTAPGSGRRNPVSPTLFPDVTVSGMSVTQYVESRGLDNMGRRGAIDDRVFRGYGEDSWMFDYAKSEMQVTLPYTAYQVPVVQVLIPVEMADTWVYQPASADVEIIDGGWMGESEITTSRVCWVQVKQQSSIRSTAKLSVSSTSPLAQASPNFESLTMDPGETRTVYFTVTNKGVSTDVAGVLTFDAVDSWSGSTTSTFTLGYTLLKHEEAPSGDQEVDDTMVTVYVYDFEFDEPVGNYEISGESTTRHLGGRTDDAGAVTFNFGKYEGRVTVEADATADFLAKTKAFNVGPGENEAVLRLESRAEPEPEPDTQPPPDDITPDDDGDDDDDPIDDVKPWWLEDWALGMINVTVLVTVVIVVAIFMRKRK